MQIPLQGDEENQREGAEAYGLSFDSVKKNGVGISTQGPQGLTALEGEISEESLGSFLLEESDDSSSSAFDTHDEL